jgi:hypothetical protein
MSLNLRYLTDHYVPKRALNHQKSVEKTTHKPRTPRQKNQPNEPYRSIKPTNPSIIFSGNYQPVD